MVDSNVECKFLFKGNLNLTVDSYMPFLSHLNVPDVLCVSHRKTEMNIRRQSFISIPFAL